MKQFSLFSILFFLGISFVSAQTAAEVTVDFDKKITAVNAISITIPGSAKSVEAVLEEKFKKETKSKGKGAGKNTGFVGVQYGKISASTMDYFYRVEKGGGKGEESSNVVLFLSLGNNNFIKSDKYPQEISAAKAELEGLAKEVKAYDLALSIKDQEKSVEKSLDAQKKLEGDATSLEKQLKEVQTNIEKNKGDQEKQKKAIEDEQNKLKQLKADLEAISK
ncbi:MAG: hypothetical protein ACKVTZ_20840 [Bacteroidia bacterium]